MISISGEKLFLDIGDKRVANEAGEALVLRIHRGFLTQSSWIDDADCCLLPTCAKETFLRVTSLNPIFYFEIVHPRNHQPKKLNEAFTQKFKVKAEIPFHWMQQRPVEDEGLYGVDQDEIREILRGLHRG